MPPRDVACKQIGENPVSSPEFGTGQDLDSIYESNIFRIDIVYIKKSFIICFKVLIFVPYFCCS